MSILTQEARKKQEIVKQAIKNGKSGTSRKYGVSLSTLKRWCKKYDGTWQSMLENDFFAQPKSITVSDIRKW